MNTKLFMPLMLLFSAFSVVGQNILVGKISTEQKSEAIAAIIYIPQLEKGTSSDFNGNYTLTNIPDGKYTVIFSSLGYATISEKINFSAANTITKDIVFNQSAVEMEEVIISTPFHKLQSDNVMKVERVSTQELQRKGSVTLADGITQIAGVEIISTGIGIGKPVIRGLSSNRVLTYTQGIRLENQQFGDEHGLGVNQAGIESVEVIKGPASLLYGSDALGGVLYLNPEKFANSSEIEADISSTYISNTLGSGTTFGIKTSGEKLKFLARGTYNVNSDYETGDKTRVTNSRFNEKDLKTGIQFQGTLLKSTLRYNYNRSNIGIPEEIGEQTQSKDLELPFQEIDNHILSLENTLFLKNSSIDIKGGYLFNDSREFEDSETAAALRLKLNTLNYDLKYNLPQLGKFETVLGVQGMHQKNENKGEEILIPNAITNDFGVLGTTHYHLDKIDFQAGFRFDTRNIESEAARESDAFDFIAPVSRNFTSFTAAIGAKVNFTEDFTGRLNLASGFRAPNLAELTSNGVHEGTNRYEIGNPNLNKEQNFQSDLSLEYRNQHVEVFANGFYNAVNDYIFISPTDMVIDNNQVFEYLQNNAALYGGEFGLHIHPHPLDWLHIESSFETVTGKQKNDSNLPLIPANTLKNTVRLEFAKVYNFKDIYAFLGLNNTFMQKNISPFETETDGYNLLNAGFGGNLTINKTLLKLGLSANNITNKVYVAHLSRLKQDAIPNIGRNITVRLSLEL